MKVTKKAGSSKFNSDGYSVELAKGEKSNIHYLIKALIKFSIRSLSRGLEKETIDSTTRMDKHHHWNGQKFAEELDAIIDPKKTVARDSCQTMMLIREIYEDPIKYIPLFSQHEQGWHTKGIHLRELASNQNLINQAIKETLQEKIKEVIVRQKDRCKNDKKYPDIKQLRQNDKWFLLFDKDETQKTRINITLEMLLRGALEDIYNHYQENDIDLKEFNAKAISHILKSKTKWQQTQPWLKDCLQDCAILVSRGYTNSNTKSNFPEIEQVFSKFYVESQVGTKLIQKIFDDVKKDQEQQKEDSENTHEMHQRLKKQQEELRIKFKKDNGKNIFELIDTGEITDKEIGKRISDAIKNGHLPNGINDYGETPLIYAVGADNIPACNMLLSRGAKPNIKQESNGATALHYAVWNNRFEAFAVLLEKFASPFIKNNHGKTALDFIKGKSDDKQIRFYKTLIEHGYYDDILHDEEIDVEIKLDLGMHVDLLNAGFADEIFNTRGHQGSETSDLSSETASYEPYETVYSSSSSEGRNLVRRYL